MSKEWKESNLKEISTHKKGFAFKSKDFVESGVPIVKVRNFTSDSIDVTECNYVTEESFQTYSSYELFTDDVVIATVGSWLTNPNSVVGKTIKVPKSANGTLLNQNAVILRANESADQKYLFYLLKNDDFKYYIVGTAQGSANQASITLNDIYNYQFNLPPLKEQKAIAHILGKLDDKIELNRRMNQTLEQMAQALFKSWFTDFDPVLDNALAQGNEIPEALHSKAEKRKAVASEQKLAHTKPKLAAQFPSTFVYNETLGKYIPEGWEVKKLGDDIKVKHGYAFKGEFFTPEPTNDLLLTPGNFKIGGGFKSDKFKYYDGEVPVDYVLSEGDLIITMTDLSKEGDTLGFPAFTPRPNGKRYLHNQRLGKAEYLNESLEKEYLYYQLCLPQYRALIVGGASGTTVKHTSPTKICGIDYLKAPHILQTSFGKFIQCFNSKMNTLDVQTETLTRLREVLLPQLISGKLKVPEALLEIANAGESL